MNIKRILHNRYGRLLASLLMCLAMTSMLLADNERPEPEAPNSEAGGAVEDQGGAPSVAGDETGDTAASKGNSANSAEWVKTRRDLPGEPVKLGFKEAPVDEQMFAFIAESTGKVVMPVNYIAIKNKKITLLNDEFIDRDEALDMLFQAFRLNGVGVIEKDDVIIIGNIDELMPIKQYPVLTAEDDVMQRQDKGSLVLKIFALKEVRAEEVAEQIGENLPSHATLSADSNSNQILVAGDIALCQYLQQLITQLDHKYIEPETRTFRLAYADATSVAENIFELFEPSRTTGAPGRAPGRRPTPRGGRTPTPSRPGERIGPEIELRVTVSVQQNSLTVTAEPSVVERIDRLIDEEWDLPRSPGTSKIYQLQYTDPIKVAEKLNSLLGQGSGGGGVRRAGGRAGGEPSTVEQILSGIFRIEPYPDTRQLLVFSKTEESLDFLDKVIESLDQPTSIGLPFVVELKHANAIELCEELNALLAEAGAGVTIPRPETGLTGPGIDEDSAAGGSGGGGTAGSAGTMDFPWQRGGRQRDDETPPSPLIGRVRIVPIVRQNALAILCPRPQEEAVKGLIQFFDRPGRQVMISAIIVEIELNDELALGWRMSNSEEILGGSLIDNRLGGTFSVTGEIDQPFENIFDTSLLDTTVSVSLVIQALQQRTNVRILQNPIVFTADNQEAYFFDGQDIPFLTNRTINTQGQPSDSYDYKKVGVVLNVRPRITVERDVDIEINLELSSMVPGQTLFGGAILDRRQSMTHVIVKNGQTIVLSGIRRDTESKITRGIPLLMDIPLIGELFKHRENTTTITELVAFITPYVVDNPSENDTNFQQDYRNRLEELSRPVEEQIRERRRHPEKYRKLLLPDFEARKRMLEEEANEGEAEPEAPVDIDEVLSDE